MEMMLETPRDRSSKKGPATLFAEDLIHHGHEHQKPYGNPWNTSSVRCKNCHFIVSKSNPQNQIHLDLEPTFYSAVAQMGSLSYACSARLEQLFAIMAKMRKGEW